jgi:hypothetical protein
MLPVCRCAVTVDKTNNSLFLNICKQLRKNYLTSRRNPFLLAVLAGAAPAAANWIS